MTKRKGPEDYEPEPPLFATSLNINSGEVEMREPPLPPHRGVPTSVAASESMRNRAVTDRARVLGVVASGGGATTDEIEVALSLRHQNASARVWELAGNGGHPCRIRDSGRRRKTRSGRTAIVWETF